MNGRMKLYHYLVNTIKPKGFDTPSKISNIWDEINKLAWEEYNGNKINYLVYNIEDIFKNNPFDSERERIEEIKKLLMETGWTPPPSSITKL